MALTPQEIDELRTIERICVTLADALKAYHEHSQVADAAGKLARRMRDRAEVIPSLEARVTQVEQAIRALDRRTQPRINANQLRRAPTREPSQWRPIEPPLHAPTSPPVEIDISDAFEDIEKELRKEGGLDHPVSR
jgi:chromatin segregation and condensation protein Rec8/ScpA/Scc1 (kleisin family)